MTAKDRVRRFLEEDAALEENRNSYLGCTNGVVESGTGLNPHTIRRVLGELIAEGTVRRTTTLYRIVQ